MQSDERAIQKALIKHLEARAFSDVVWLHVNNTPRWAGHGALLKAMGLQRGAPDLIIGMPGITIAHEIKTEIGKLSKYQKVFHDRLKNIRWTILVTYGLDDALKQYVNLGILRGS